MTSKKRTESILRRQPTDRLGLFEVFRTETARRCSADGHFARPELKTPLLRQLFCERLGQERRLAPSD